MINYVFRVFICFSLVGVYSLSASATEIIHYSNLPVTVELRVGEERSIQFGDHVKFGLTRGQKVKKQFRAQSAQGAVHFLPYEAFDKQRIQIQRITDGRVILLDLIAVEAKSGEKPLENIRVVLDTEDVVDTDDMEMSLSAPTQPIVTPVELTRFASQTLYGPTRLHRARPGITETVIGVQGAIRIFKGENKLKTYSKPIVAYQGGGYYLAGIHIKNISGEKIQLDYLDLNLPFSHATFQHHVLSANGTPGDSTVLYLISEYPLKETLYPWTYYQDLKAVAEAIARLERESKVSKQNGRKHK